MIAFGVFGRRFQRSDNRGRVRERKGEMLEEPHEIAPRESGIKLRRSPQRADKMPNAVLASRRLQDRRPARKIADKQSSFADELGSYGRLTPLLRTANDLSILRVRNIVIPFGFTNGRIGRATIEHNTHDEYALSGISSSSLATAASRAFSAEMSPANHSLKSDCSSVCIGVSGLLLIY
jgi:hypothetical protein